MTLTKVALVKKELKLNFIFKKSCCTNDLDVLAIRREKHPTYRSSDKYNRGQKYFNITLVQQDSDLQFSLDLQTHELVL